MASNATTHRPGRAARVVHRMFPSRTHLAITIAIEIALPAFGLPLWAHLLLGVLLHLAIVRAL